MEYIWGFLRGMGLGALGVTSVIVIIILGVNLVFADEAVPVREATLGEQNRSLNYTVDDATRDRAANMDTEVTITVNHFDTPPAPTCAQINGRLEFIRTRIHKYQERTPKYAHIYQEALDEIAAAWCHDND